jgi:hypothetical protein
MHARKHAHTHMHAHAHGTHHTHIHTCTHIHTYMHAHITDTCTHTHTHTCMHTHHTRMHACTHITQTCTHAHIHTWTHTHHTHVHAHIHTHICTHTQTRYINSRSAAKTICFDTPNYTPIFKPFSPTENFRITSEYAFITRIIFMSFPITVYNNLLLFLFSLWRAGKFSTLNNGACLEISITSRHYASCICSPLLGAERTGNFWNRLKRNFTKT